ncbi:hypothetical protein A0H81_11740 [Grifola frondosa]|uniref:Uncharacterized protein n=1 Tax=Grifola frondosa TaxID=5627 RepID=A0A1C7LVL5_GRIFR|nr:hypothetical protein A0H81_11740 [Grifola frondosa]
MVDHVPEACLRWIVYPLILVNLTLRDKVHQSHEIQLLPKQTSQRHRARTESNIHAALVGFRDQSWTRQNDSASLRTSRYTQPIVPDSR